MASSTWTIQHCFETRPCHFYDKHGNKHKCIFHQFADGKAIIELDDGSVMNVDVEDIVFADSAERFIEMRWNDD